MENRDKQPKKKQDERRPLLFEGFGSKEEHKDALCRLEQYLKLLSDWAEKVKGDFDPPSLN